ncbi:nuclear transport factor 2 family protein [Aromatoleum toluclasticum]|uniref:nuclear transport factor 2 family protein n=1 Tax=Aromatoleum toluclasticum TaxID=92003 RepID=UPI000377ED96|nr:nuclear transport factor 2 family protein [Aromatoleum toluclasticum]
MNEDVQARSDIAQVVLRYAEVLDKKQLDRLDTVFSPNAQLVYLLGEQLIRFSMCEAQDVFGGFLRKCWWTCHTVSNPVIEIDRDLARASSRAHATHIQIRDDGTRNVWTVAAAYDDELVREVDGWRIRQRRCDARYEDGTFLAAGVRQYDAPPVFPV